MLAGDNRSRPKNVKKISYGPFIMTAIIVVIISLMLFIVLPLYNILKESFLSADGRVTLLGYISHHPLLFHFQ